MAVLVHRQDGHPVGGRVADAEAAIRPAHLVGEAPAAGDHDEPASATDARQGRHQATELHG
jgi:hypothetical protein